MATTIRDPRAFFTHGTAAQYEYVFGLYEQAIGLKAEQKNKKPEEFIKLDKWYQTELPKKIKSRGKDALLTHEELVLCMKWKLARGKYSPRIKDLVQMNTPRLCQTETKKAFRALLKKEDLSSAIQALCNLKGVGPAMASVILTAANPEECGFMADECLMAIPQIESIDYTTKELLNFVDQLKVASERLNKEGNAGWNPHKIEQTLWTHTVVCELKKELLDGIPGGLIINSQTPTENGGTENVTQREENGAAHPEESNDSVESGTDNKENVATNGTSGADDDSRPSLLCEDTNDSVAASEPASEAPSEPLSETPSESNDGPVLEDEEDSVSEPVPKKLKVDE